MTGIRNRVNKTGCGLDGTLDLLMQEGYSQARSLGGDKPSCGAGSGEEDGKHDLGPRPARGFLHVPRTVNPGGR